MNIGDVLSVWIYCG